MGLFHSYGRYPDYEWMYAMKKVTKKDLARAVRLMQERTKQLEEWQDMSRTVTASELSKICPGWFDN